MPLVCLGLSHHTAPVEVRERHAIFPARVWSKPWSHCAITPPSKKR